MNRLEEKKATRESRRAKNAGKLRLFLLVGFVVVVALFFGVKFYRQAKMNAQLDAQIAELEAKIEAQAEEKEHYDNLTELYKTEEYQKLFAKERLGLVEENEKVFIDVSGE